jgi:hypothetical protein
MFGRGEGHALAAAAEDATQIDSGLSVLPERGVPRRIRLRQYAAPAEFAFEQTGIAEIDAIGGAEFDEITVALMPRLMENPEVLVKLRKRFAVADEIAHEQRFRVGGVADEAGGLQEIGIESPVERSQMAAKCAAFDQNAGGAGKDPIAQGGNDRSHRHDEWNDRIAYRTVGAKTSRDRAP